jgi:hypothetical protein
LTDLAARPAIRRRRAEGEVGPYAAGEDEILSAAIEYSIRLHAARSAPYRPKRYSGRVHLFKAAIQETSIINESPPPYEMSWRGLVEGDLDVHCLPGGHMEIVKDPLAALTAKAIEGALDEST